MLSLRNFRFFQDVLSNFSTKHTAQVHALRRLTSTSTDTKNSKDDMPMNMENPYKAPSKGCILCQITVDHKNIQLLSQFISPHTGRIYGRHITGLCGQKQREVTKAIKKARHIGFMSVTLKDPSFMKDPNLCNIKHLE